MVTGPIPFDMLMRPIKYVSGPGVFVAGAFGRSQKYAFVLRDDRQGGAHWQKVADITDAFPYTAIHCGAFGMAGGSPRYVLAGEAIDVPSEGDVGSPDLVQRIIMTSADGNSWTQSLRGPPTSVYLMAWDEEKKRFYAQAFNSKTDNIEVLESADGSGWSTVSTIPATSGDKASPLLEATGTPLIKDVDGKIVPYGGLFGWDRGGNVWITPKFPSGVYNPGARDYGSDVEIVRKRIEPDGTEIITRENKTLPMMRVVCVGYSGGIWQAAGFDFDGDNDRSGDIRIASSTDTGNTWKIVYSHNEEMISCLIAGRPTANPPPTVKRAT